MTTHHKPPAAITIDLDPLWHYLGARGYTWNASINAHCVTETSVPRFLEVLERHDARATFFVVGKDLEHAASRDTIRQAVRAGHEAANHSMNHVQRFADLTLEEKRREIVEAGDRIEAVAGSAVVGFRAPGWNIDNQAVSVLEERNYLYDSSVFPSYLRLPIKAFNHIKERGRLGSCLGKGLGLMFAPLRPYHPSSTSLWRRGSRRIVEAPVAVVPKLRFPFFATMTYAYGLSLFRWSYSSLARASTPFVYELHGLDLVDFKDVKDDRLATKPGLKWPLLRKLETFDLMLETFSKHYRLVSLAEYVRELQP